MSRVFVSCAYRDRDAGRRVSELLRGAGHEPVDDSDEARGSAWWNEVIGRIDSCDAFVAVVSPAYGEAHTCRLAAKRAVAAALPVVRVELDGERRFDPSDRRAGAVLARAVDRALSGESGPPAPAPEQAPGPTAPPGPAVPPAPSPSSEPHSPGRSWTGVDLAVGAVLLAAAAGLVLVTTLGPGRDEPAPPAAPAASPATSSAATPAPVSPAPATDAATAALLATLAAVDSDRLPASSCTAGDEQVTCRDPAPSIGPVVLQAYPSTAALYDAYRAQVEALAGGTAPENVGDCSAGTTEGEFSWDLDRGHGTAVSVAEEAAGGLDPVADAAGRLFCTTGQGVVRLVWTQDPGLLVTATGQPADLTIGWWHDVHLDLACPALGDRGSGCPQGAS